MFFYEKFLSSNKKKKNILKLIDFKLKSNEYFE